jgi:hypothetical protein
MSLKTDMHTALMTVAPTAPAKNSQFYGGKELTYITFFCYNEQGEVYAENKEIETGYYFQIDLWQKENGTSDLNVLKENIRSVLEPLGFMGFNPRELYETDTKINHIAIRCNYTEERL